MYDAPPPDLILVVDPLAVAFTKPRTGSVEGVFTIPHLATLATTQSTLHKKESCNDKMGRTIGQWWKK